MRLNFQNNISYNIIMLHRTTLSVRSCITLLHVRSGIIFIDHQQRSFYPLKENMFFSYAFQVSQYYLKSTILGTQLTQSVTMCMLCISYWRRYPLSALINPTKWNIIIVCYIPYF